LPRKGGVITTEEMLKSVPMPEHADPSSGFAPCGAQVEPGGPRYPFSLLDRDRVAPSEVAMLYDQAVAAQWNGNSTTSHLTQPSTFRSTHHRDAGFDSSLPRIQ